MIPLQFYNTLSKKKELFTPLQPGKCSLYVCGPTVYDLLHVGNFRGVIFFNMVSQWLKEAGYTVTFVLNFTDIDDKIIKRAQEKNQSTTDLTTYYIAQYKQDLARLNLEPHTLNPACTDHIGDMITCIESLIAKQVAYVVNGSVFYDIAKFPTYGALSGKRCCDLEAGHRVETNPDKKNPLDFVLWKPAKDNEPFWDSPWGKGRPGWHIECSAMNHALLGEQIDIHGGGIDLIFPHHENEIAQSEALTGKPFARYWMHHQFIRFGDEKMSKSLGNVIKARDYMDRYHPELLKFILLSVHYRSALDMDTTQSIQALYRLSRIYTALDHAFTHQAATDHALDVANKAVFTQGHTRIVNAFNDDFNTPIVFSVIFEWIRHYNHACSQFKPKHPTFKALAHCLVAHIRKAGTIMALFQENPRDFLTCIDHILIREKQLDVTEITRLIEQRTQARLAKDYATSDTIRDQLLALDVLIQDTPSGTQWTVKKTS